MPPVIPLEDQPILVKTANFPYANWKYDTFNPVQSRVFEYYDKEVNGLIAAATSAGKTTMAEMLLSHEMRVRGGKGLYLVPMRALAQEKIDEWTDPNHHFADKKISICTGDYRLTKERAQELEEADLIIMTSEMLNHRCQNYKSEQNGWIKKLGTAVIDEVHLLTVPGRGDHLEVGLMKLTQINSNVRLLALSATMPNANEIAEWISYSLTKRQTFVLNSKYRPCALNIHYEAYFDGNKKYDAIEEEKVQKALELVQHYPDDKFLIFAHTKRTGELMKNALISTRIKAEFHNAALDKNARIKLENKFRKEKEPRVIVATPTLAWGCYAKGTPVLMYDGTKSIENVVVGDFVLAMSSNGFVPREVLKIGTKETTECLKFALTTGEIVTVSMNHEFYGTMENKVPGYFIATEYSIGDFVAIPGKDQNVCYSEIKSIEKLSIPQTMYDLEVDQDHNFVGGGIVSHNCNLPARRVIILGMHRGLDEVETYNIFQMAGRSGRVGLDPQGDVYILLPQSRLNEFKNKLKIPQKIESQLLTKLGERHKVLSFHLVSEIHHGSIKTNEDVHDWYKRSLAYFQNQSLEETIVDGTLDLLKKCGAIGEENNILSAKPIGQVASMFYFSPFDVSDLYFNFKNLFDQEKEDDEYYLSMAIGNIDTQRLSIVSRAEKDEMSMYHNKIRHLMPGKFATDAAIKAGFCYFNMLNGINSQACSATQRNLQFDFNRLSQVLQALDGLTGQWDRAGFFKTLESRIANGIPPHLVDVCRLDNIGRARATKLYQAGYKTVEQIADADPEKIKKLLNYKQENIDQLMQQAQIIAMT